MRRDGTVSNIRGRLAKDDDYKDKHILTLEDPRRTKGTSREYTIEVEREDNAVNARRKRFMFRFIARWIDRSRVC
jgi:hypothetical protein